MTEFRRIFIDTSLYIYYLEKSPQYGNKVKAFFINSYNLGKESLDKQLRRFKDIKVMTVDDL